MASPNIVIKSEGEYHNTVVSRLDGEVLSAEMMVREAVITIAPEEPVVAALYCYTTLDLSAFVDQIVLTNAAGEQVVYTPEKCGEQVVYTPEKGGE